MYVLLLTHSSSYNLPQEVSGHFCSAALPWAVSTIISRFISWRLLLLAHISYAGSHIALALRPLHCMFTTCSFTYLSDLWHFKHSCTYYLSCLHLEMWMGFCSIHRQHRYSYEYYAQDQKESSDATQYKRTLNWFSPWASQVYPLSPSSAGELYVWDHLFFWFITAASKGG